ncbi:MAG: hypothetical protein ACI89J_001111, partial [Hyphomicrobiaceae bacterium]
MTETLTSWQSVDTDASKDRSPLDQRGRPPVELELDMTLT